MKTNNHHNISTAAIKAIMVGSYAWLTAISFGMVLLDIIYGGSVPDTSTACREAADFLLFFRALSILAALGAIGSSMDAKTAIKYFITGLAIIISGFLINSLLTPVLGDNSIPGTIIRVILTGSVSILAYMGFCKYCGERLIKISYI